MTPETTQNELETDDFVVESTEEEVTQEENSEPETVVFSEFLVDNSCPPELPTAWISVGPEQAQTILDNFNLSNRPLRKGEVKRFANHILQGKWHINGEPFIFGANEDSEVDGISLQHRCEAIVLAAQIYEGDKKSYPNYQAEIPFLVVYDVPIECSDSVDTGTSRNNNDILYRAPWVEGYIPEEWNRTKARRKKWTNTLATAARVVWQRQGGKTVSSAQKFDPQEMLDFLAVNAPLCNAVTMVLNADDNDGGNGGLRISLAYVAGLSYMAQYDAEGEFDQDAADKIEMALDHLAQGTGFDPKSPVHALTSYWNNRGPEENHRDYHVTGPFVKFLNLVLSDSTGVTPTKIKLSKKEIDNYKNAIPVISGYDQACFEYCASLQSTEEVAE